MIENFDLFIDTQQLPSMSTLACAVVAGFVLWIVIAYVVGSKRRRDELKRSRTEQELRSRDA